MRSHSSRQGDYTVNTHFRHHLFDSSAVPAGFFPRATVASLGTAYLAVGARITAAVVSTPRMNLKAMLSPLVQF